MSLMSSLYTGVSGLTVNQRGLNATAHNLSNVETTGYVRQQAVFSDSFYRTIGQSSISYFQVGHGAQADAIRQVRDIFYDKAYRQELGRQQFYQAQYEAVTEVEEILGETEGVAFQTTIKEFWEALSELAKEPDSIVTRSSFIQTAVSFMERAEKISNQIEEYQVSLNSEIIKYVDRINEIGDEIKALNAKIQMYEASKMEQANDLRDARNLLLDELGGIAGITYKENASGVVTVMLEDYPFVTEDLVYHMDTRYVNEQYGMLEPYWPCYAKVDVFRFDPVPSAEADTDIGLLKGLLLARGDRVGKYIDIPKQPKREDFANDNDFKAAEQQYKRDLKVFNTTIEPSAVVSAQAQFDQLIHGIVTTINDLLCPNKQVTTQTGEKIMILDEEKAPVGMDEDSTLGEALFSRKSMPRYEKATVTIEIDGVWKNVEVWKYNEEDPENNYSLFTLGEIRVNESLMKDPSKLPLSKQGNTGDYSIDICEAMLTAWQEPFSTLTPNEYGSGHNFNNYYREMVGALGTRGEKFRKEYTGQETLVNSIENQRQAVHAVSSDEELTNMIRFQHAYNASARYINTLDEMLEHLLNTLGR